MGGMVFGPGALIAVGLYLVSMIGVGWIARTRRRSNSMADFYLAGRSMGLLVLFLTLYATQYSGNTLFGYTGTAYRIGFGWTASVLFMFSVIVGYMLFAPRLVTLARKEGFITPGDYITHRFRSSVLTLLSTILMIYALGNYALAQLKAMGAAVEGITDGAVPGSYGIIGLAVIMVIYETLGGMRSVAWTDMMQGGVLLLGFGILVFLIPQKLGGGLGHVVAQLSEMDPSKVQAPSLEGANKWISYVLLLGCGAAIYPQAIQRLYASRSVAVLKRSLTLMAFMPLTTTLVALVCGLTAVVVLPDLNLTKTESDQVLARLCALVMGESALGYWLVVAIFAAVLAALMSTADSALLSISSMFTKDIYLPYFRPQATEAELTKVGKICSWVIVAVLVAVAIGTDATLVRLLELKFEVLIQVVPCFFLGLYWKRLSAQTALLGMVCGLAVALGLTFGGKPMIWGFHAGVIGLVVNVAVCAIGACCKPATSE
ncbi:MAG: sodium:solute symporter family protein [Gemmatimonadetes bacterium]|nr:sodium:solute symporter family protein [Gemmatimonadota bacterium]MYC70690.1 sodium:solute symporter family protein [Gemmatimonadota bacterium]MYI61079.1 sodium:solute symporter family protein [Gemmatimonadota bacterium]